jgi:hypothetical protein
MSGGHEYGGAGAGNVLHMVCFFLLILRQRFSYVTTVYS